LDEVIKLSDRVIVIHDGELMGELMGKDIVEKKIGLMMAGEKGGK